MIVSTIDCTMISTLNAGDFCFKELIGQPWRSQLKLGSQKNHHETPKRIAEPAWDFASMLIL